MPSGYQFSLSSIIAAMASLDSWGAYARVIFPCFRLNERCANTDRSPSSVPTEIQASQLRSLAVPAQLLNLTAACLIRRKYTAPSKTKALPVSLQRVRQGLFYLTLTLLPFIVIFLNEPPTQRRRITKGITDRGRQLYVNVTGAV
jgi:hypothetical protein